MTPTCHQCDAALPPVKRGRPRRYCSRACQASAYRTRRQAAKRRQPAAASSAASHLTAATIAAEAVALADSDGLPSVTMRRVAASFGVATMVLYRYFPRKADLLVAMTEHALSSHADATYVDLDWRAGLEYEAWQEWRLYRQHPWLLEVLARSRPPISPRLMAAIERALSHLQRAEPPVPGDNVWLYLTLNAYIQGAALLVSSEVGVAPERTSSVSPTDLNTEWDSLAEELENLLATGNFPYLAAHYQEISTPSTDATVPARRANMNELEFDEWFEFGLARTLDGIEQYLFQNRS